MDFHIKSHRRSLCHPKSPPHLAPRHGTSPRLHTREGGAADGQRKISKAAGFPGDVKPVPPGNPEFLLQQDYPVRALPVFAFLMGYKPTAPQHFMGMRSGGLDPVLQTRGLRLRPMIPMSQRARAGPSDPLLCSSRPGKNAAFVGGME